MSKTKANHRFNFVDVIIILAIIAVVAAIVWIVLAQSGTIKTGKTARVEYTVRFTLVREELASYVKTGDTVLNSGTGNEIGKVIAVRHPEKSKYRDNRTIVGSGEERTLQVSDYPDLYDVYVTVSSEAAISDSGVATVDGNKILIGAPIYFRDGQFAREGYIIAFEIKDM
ncbi:MAG: DUF4330 family protein [Clostridia bacterium]|nr:DUF4330 family protein [Clostridia bacterium]MBR7083237.1 DUF4330 family protein [Clostridia bacterium]